jgi:hypothetical protein
MVLCHSTWQLQVRNLTKMPLPTYVVELQFGSSSYIDVTQYVQNISINRGINRNLDDFSAGSVSVTFVNNNRVFDPLNTSSPLWFVSGGYTIVQPAGRIRISSNGVRRFTGFVQDWDFNYEDAGFDGTATVTALDMMYRVSNASFTGGQAWDVEPTSDRIKTVMNYNGFGAVEYGGVTGTETMLGTDVWDAGQNVLSYLQNVARSEPADFYSNASAVMQLKDRSFANYIWNNSLRQNYVNYPSTAVGSALTDESGGNYQWPVIGSRNLVVASQFGGTVYRGGTVAAAIPEEQFIGFEYKNINVDRYSAAGSQYVFSSYLYGNSGTYEGFFALLDSGGGVIASTAVTQASAGATVFTRIGAVLTNASTSVVGGAQLTVGITGSTVTTGTAMAGEGFQIEPGTAFVNYFDGGYNPYLSTASTKYDVAWGASPYASTSGLLTATATAITAPALVTFADSNSQGTAFGNGTGIPFTDLEVVYASEQLYNKVQVVGVNATAVVEDSASQLLYGLRGYGQTDNLTTSITRPAEIASAFLGEFRLPEYRAQALTVALESLTTAQQTAVLGIEIRDVVRVCFQPSAQGSVVDKYYQVLGVSANADVERDAITLNLASLDNLPFRLDSLYLGVLDTGILA